MPRPALAAFILALLALHLLPLAAPAAAQPGTPACKRELAETDKKMAQSLALVSAAMKMAPRDRCPTYSKAQELVSDIRRGMERCVPDAEHAQAIRNADDVDDALTKSVNRDCPPARGMIRINAIFVKRIAPKDMPKGLATLHACETTERMRFVDEPFDNGRIMLAGCTGTGNASAQAQAARNASAKALSDEQSAIYLAMDSTGRGARRLSLPILTPDGREVTTDLVPAEGTSPQSRDRIAGNWAPAKDGVCRIHAEWTVTGGKPTLVLWQELADCSRSGPPEFKTILDRR
jgi:hypothetical protein